MQDWIGQITASFVAVAVVLILFGARLSGERASIAVTQYRAAKVSSLNLASLLERDLRSMGSLHPCAGETPDLNTTYFDYVITELEFDDPTERFIEFNAQTERCQAPTSIRYEWDTDGTTVMIDGEDRPLWSMRRFEGGVLTAFTNRVISDVRLDLMKNNGDNINNRAETQRIDVEIRMVSPLGIDDLLGETRWTTTVHPHAMTIWGRL